MQSGAPVFVAGKSGQLARCLAAVASCCDVRVVTAGRPEFDIQDGNSIDRIINDVAPQAVINAAAYTAVDKAESEPEHCYAINRDGAGQLAATAWRRGVPFIHVSTDYVFDGCQSSPYREDDDTAPLGAYGRSKQEGEAAVLAAHPEAIVVRTSWLYSSFASNFVTTMLKLGHARSVVRVVADQHGCPTSAHDLASALLDIARQVSQAAGADRAGVYHLAGTGQTTWCGLAAKVFANGKNRGWRVPVLEPITTAEYPTPARRPANSVLDCAKIKRSFGIELPPWSESVAACVNRL